MSKIISKEEIESFLNGADPEPYIVGVEYDYRTNAIYKIIQHPEKGKIIKKDTFIPFLWVGDITKLNFYGGDKNLQKKKMNEHSIVIQRLETYNNERLENGLTYIVKSLKGYTNLISFFKQGGIDPWSEKYKKYFTILSVSEQYLIQKKKRLFKGIEDYDGIHKLVFDIETTGLNPETDRIILIGVKDNRGLQRTINAYGEDGEKLCIIEFFETLRDVNPTIIGGYNSAEFDFPFILKRAEILGLDIEKLSTKYMEGIKRRDGMLKLANEIEQYNHYTIWGFNIIDISHAVRRAQAINSDIKFWNLKYINKYLEKEKPNRVYVDGAFISKIYQDNDSYYINPKTGRYKKIGDPGTENLLEKYPGKYEIWTGRRIVEQYLDDDLYETMIADESFSQSTFLLSKLVPTTYERVGTMGTATLWRLIMLAWSYEHNLAIPKKYEKRRITGGLSRLLTVGYAKNIVKFDFSSLYPSIQLVFDVFPDCDVTGVQKALLKYFRDLRIFYKREAERYSKINTSKSDMFNRKQLPIKIFINAYFGSLSAPLVYDWGDMDKGETITCVGRQFLRMMVMWFMKKGYKPLVMDTDGVNFESPSDIESRVYIGKGLNELVEKGKIYHGIAADVAEFNDIFLRNEMGLDIDYIAPSCVNVSRKNYIIKKPNGKIKLTGNSIKSKKIQQYVSEFLDEGLPHLLNGDGQSFLNLYYSYIEKIYNKQIPLAKMANKARVKQTAEEYKKYCKKKTKIGNDIARQAHMELVLLNNYPATLGETIYYINNGTKKGDGDVKKTHGYVPPYDKYTRKELNSYMANNGELPPVESFIQINCYMIPESQIQNNPDMLGDYNVPRYISMFNKKVEPLLVVFKPEIRNDILITNPTDRQFFTELQCELDSGTPLKVTGQDTIDEVMTLSEGEVLFWNKVKRDPYFMYLDGTLELVDQYWVNYNKKVVNHQLNGVKDNINDEEEVIETDGNDYAVDLIFS